jgi:hypothetical protein
MSNHKAFRRGSRAVAGLMLAASAGCYGGRELNGAGGDSSAATDGAEGRDSTGGADSGEEPQGLCSEPSVGLTRLRRVTGAQYDNTIRDLLGIEANLSVDFVPDERVGPFTSNVSAAVTELQVEQYQSAAETAVELAVTDLSSLLPCDPAATGEDECAREFLAEFAPRAYRRPLEAGELDKLVAVYNDGKAEEDFANGIRIAVAAALQSPHFLYHVEFGRDAAEGAGLDGGTVALTDYELASRLSYFLWDTMPDADLFAAADAGDLRDPDALAKHVDRMLEDLRAQEAIGHFHTQWLGIDEVELVEKDTGLYPDFDALLATAMKEDVAAFANHVIFEGDAKIETLLSASYTVTDDPALLDLYGVDVPAGHQAGDPIALDPTERAGILTMPAVLARQAHADQTSPIHRGVLVRQHFFCQMLPPPPPDVDNVAPDPDPNATTRERFAEHTANAACSGCHNLIDPIGFGLENYDPVGAFRTEEGSFPIDASGQLLSTDVDQPFEGGVELAQIMSGSAEVRECVSQQWFRFATGRGETSDDGCTLEHLAETMTDSDGDIRALIQALVLSDAFRFRRADAAADIAPGQENDR